MTSRRRRRTFRNDNLRRHGNHRRRWALSRVLIYAALTLFALIYAVPALLVFFNSFRDGEEVFRNGIIAIPESFSFDNYLRAWNDACVSGMCRGRALWAADESGEKERTEGSCSQPPPPPMGSAPSSRDHEDLPLLTDQAGASRRGAQGHTDPHVPSIS